MRKFITLLMILVSLVGVAGTYGVDDLPNVQLADRTKHLVNPDGIVSGVVGARIDSLLLDARRQSSAEVVAVIVDNIDTDDIDTYATNLFNKWGIGKKDKNNGILLIVSKDGHAATIRAGYGAEGILPDIISGRIIRNDMIPYFSRGDYEGGMLAGVEAIHSIVTNPEYREELMSKYGDNYGGGDAVVDKFFDYYLGAGVGVAIVMALLLGYRLLGDRGKTDYEKYESTQSLVTPYLVASVGFVFIPAVVFLVLWLLRRHWRLRPRKCQRCGTTMSRLDEDTDNKYLTMAQDLEERLNSVDYDVWLCPECGETDIYSYVNKSSSYTECPNCHAHTLGLSGTRVLQKATTKSEGRGEKIYTCRHCNFQQRQPYIIPQKETPIVVVGGGGGGGFGGGGSIGGGFGGGLTGGGGATGRW